MRHWKKMRWGVKASPYKFIMRFVFCPLSRYVNTRTDNGYRLLFADKLYGEMVLEKM